MSEITVTESDVVEATFTALARRLHTDTTDYANWVGIRDTGRLVFSLLSGEREPTEVEKVSFRRPARYKKLLGRLYWKEASHE